MFKQAYFTTDMINNAYKLSAVLTQWINPVVQQFAAGRMASLPFVQLIENKVKSSGWVSPAWSLASEISPLLNNVSGALVQPLLQRYISSVPDEQLPKMAHRIVDEAIKQGSLSLMEGRVVFEKEDLEELKQLLNYNLPISQEEEYEVITEPRAEDSAQ